MGEASITADRPTPAREARGSNQLGVRLYNERLVLSLVRRHRSLAKAEIARLTGLSPQTVSVIVKQLEADGLLLREAPMRGRIGQPSVPFALNPHGALALGLKIGRRSADLVLIDFLGRVLASRRETYPYPRPEPLLAFAHASAAAVTRDLAPDARARVAGLGIAIPYEIWSWGEEVGAPGAVLDAWRAFDPAAELAARLDWPVLVCNDATAACAAELTLGEGGRFRDFVYFFVGSFVGGGVVLGGNLHVGRTGNAGALGSLPVPGPDGPRQLIRAASLYGLERQVLRAGEDPSGLWRAPELWEQPLPALDAWLEEAAEALAVAAVAASAVIDFEAAVIDGAMPVPVRSRLVEAVRVAASRLDDQGLSPIEIVEGSVGAHARAIGGATLPLLANFARDREVLFKEIASA